MDSQFMWKMNQEVLEKQVYYELTVMLIKLHCTWIAS